MGDDSTEPWLCGHSTLLAHAHATDLYRTKYAHQEGRISIVLNIDWSEPLDKNSASDQAAAQRKRDFDLSWFADPIYLNGDYPESMKAQLGGIGK
jgi:beta-glucosidase